MKVDITNNLVQDFKNYNINRSQVNSIKWNVPIYISEYRNKEIYIMIEHYSQITIMKNKINSKHVLE